MNATYDILVGIHEDIEAILFGLSQHGNGVVYPLFVVLAWPRVLYGLPCEDVAYGVVAPTPQPREVRGRILQGEGPVYKGHVVAVKEVFGYMRRLVGSGGTLGISGTVDAVQRDFAVLGVAECSSVDTQPNRRHY